ncbi:hypothetical protein [Dysgonomonas capnocytophagoides]|uniref:hypothetical protein n=1 Tax=Dysgonomonas capnocytophagoides TaxID=45254 RepID=UPI00334146D7
MRDNDNIADFDYEKDFNEAFNNVTESEIIDNQPLSLDPVIERRSIFPMEDPVDSTQQNNIISNETVMQMITENNIEDFERLKAEQNFPMAVLGGVLASIICVFIWAIITVATKYQISYMAMGVGVAVGFTIQKFGKGLTPVYGILGAGLALIACFCGNIISYTCFIADQYESYSYLEAISNLNWDISMSIAIETFQPMDVLFYGLAIYTGYMFSIKRN